jgi:ubiquinone/menaquinone biosynthesis C-methylase UbiE
MDARSRLEQLQSGYQIAAIILTANHLGVFAALADRNRPAADLAAELGLDARALETLLLALAGEGILKVEGGGFCLASEFAPFLLPGGPRSLASISEHHFHLMQRWVRLEEVVRTGRPLPRPSGRRPPDELRAFICGMADLSRTASEEVADKLDFSPFHWLLDVGGGPGTASLVFARHWPHLTCTVFDLPDVVAIAQEEIDRAGLGARVKTATGDYFTDELGEGYDVAYIASIIHSLGPQETAALFAKTRRALVPGGMLVVKEFFLDDTRTRPASASRFSVNMLIGTERGKSYTYAETREILAREHFGDFWEIEIGPRSGLIVARSLT